MFLLTGVLGGPERGSLEPRLPVEGGGRSCRSRNSVVESTALYLREVIENKARCPFLNRTSGIPFLYRISRGVLVYSLRYFTLCFQLLRNSTTVQRCTFGVQGSASPHLALSVPQAPHGTFNLTHSINGHVLCTRLLLSLHLFRLHLGVHLALERDFGTSFRLVIDYRLGTSVICSNTQP